MASGKARAKHYLTQTAFAALAGVSAPAVSKALREGRVVITPKGMNPDNPLNRQFIELHRAGRQSTTSAAGKKAAGRPRDGKTAGLVAQRIIADTQLKREQTASHQQRRLERMGVLVLKEITDRRLAVLGGEVKARFLDLPARVFPQISALVRAGREEEALAHLEAEISEALTRTVEKATS